MTDSVTDLRDTILPKSDQLNADDLLIEPITVRVTAVKRCDSKEQPVAVHIDGGRQPYKPCLSMRRVLILAWGSGSAGWVGRSMTLYRDPKVKWAGAETGGIRISHLSHLSAPLAISLTVTRGKRSPFTVRPLVVSEPVASKAAAPDNAVDDVFAPATARDVMIAELRAAYRMDEAGVLAACAAMQMSPREIQDAPADVLADLHERVCSRST